MIIAANWKMNMGFQQSLDFVSQIKKRINEKEDLESFLFFPPVCLSGLFQKELFHWGGQNIYYQTEGAFTGETSAKTLKEMGAEFCLVGHSERRWIFGESNADIEAKFSLLQTQALIPILCVGENLSDRLNKKQMLKNQLSWIKDYKKYDKLPWNPDQLPRRFNSVPFIVAYEPVWSIGTGETPSVLEINETAQFIKEYLPHREVKFFYGGSVNEKNIQFFAKGTFIDGFLIGGASLDPDRLYNMYQELKR